MQVLDETAPPLSAVLSETPVRLRVLVIDDDDDDASLTRLALAEIPWFTCAVDCANSYRSALAAIRVNEYDVILLDHGLGAQSGLDLMKEAFGATLPVAVVLLTGIASHQVDEAASRAGIAHMLAKSELRSGALERSVRYALERTRIERDLRSTRAFFRAAFDARDDHVAILNARGEILEVNRAWADCAPEKAFTGAMSGRGANYLDICEAASALHGAEASAVATGLHVVLAGDTESFTVEYPHPDLRQEVWFAFRAARFSDGKAVRIMVSHENITARRHAVRELVDSEARYRVLFNSNPLPMWIIDDETCRCLSVNDAALEKYGYSRQEFLSLQSHDIRFPREAADAHAVAGAPIGPPSDVGPGRHRKKSGEMLDVEVLAHPIEFAGRHCHSVLATDVTERRRAEQAAARLVQALRESEEQYRGLVELSPDGILIHVDGLIVFANSAAARILNATSPAALLELPIRGLAYEVDLSSERAALVAGESSPRIETKWTTVDGTVRDVEVSSVGFVFGDRHAVQTVFRDTTAHRKLEEELRQAQRMEAVGRLAGGVAHDFNNLLTVIIVNVELMLEELPADHPHRADARDVRDAANRAAGLTKQLLAFSRKQILQAHALDFSVIVANVKHMLSRLIRTDIVVETRLASALAPIIADAGQLEQVVLNLAVNARDAMPFGGRLVMETSEVDVAVEQQTEDRSIMPAGRYVRLSVSDSGTGITTEARSQMFEPFFTTKALGLGTGLGLATVYGIVKQSGGYLTVDSQVGVGTTFNIFLPISESALAEGTQAASLLAEIAGSETILLVEDEQLLRSAASRTLASHGYAVLAAGNGREGIELAGQHVGPIHLVLSDVMMPEVNGVQLVAMLAGERPATRVLFMSGYADGDVIRASVEAAGTAVLQKPFSPLELLQAVRRALDA